MFSRNFTECLNSNNSLFYFPLPSIASSSTLQTILVEVISQNTFVQNVKFFIPLMNPSVERSGVTVYTYSTKKCTHCEFGYIACGQDLVRKIVSRPDHPRIYPHKVYCYTIISTLQRFFCRPGFYDLIESMRSTYTDTIIRYIFQGQIWKDFLTYGGQPFLLPPLCYAMVLNID